MSAVDFRRFHQIVEATKDADEAEFARLADLAAEEFQQLIALEVRLLQAQIDEAERKLKP